LLQSTTSVTGLRIRSLWNTLVPRSEPTGESAFFRTRASKPFARTHGRSVAFSFPRSKNTSPRRMRLKLALMRVDEIVEATSRHTSGEKSEGRAEKVLSSYPGVG